MTSVKKNNEKNIILNLILQNFACLENKKLNFFSFYFILRTYKYL